VSLWACPADGEKKKRREEEVCGTKGLNCSATLKGVTNPIGSPCEKISGRLVEQQKRCQEE